jgi:hypothetical protein
MKGIAFAAWIAAILTGCSAFEVDCSKGPVTFETPVIQCFGGIGGMCVQGAEYVTYCDQPPQEPEQIRLD